MSVPASWQHFTQENLERARQQREFSVKLRGEMDALMKACATDMWNQSNCVNNAFNARVQQTKDANAKLMAHLQKVQNRSGHIKQIRIFGRVEILPIGLETRDSVLTLGYSLTPPHSLGFGTHGLGL